MHLIIDIRSRHPEDALAIRYAKNWVKKWKSCNPHDVCTFLIFDTQEAPEEENFFRVRPTGWLSARKNITSTNKNEIFRCVNFSRYEPYDPKIPTITHIFDMAKWFYDNETNANILRRKEREYEIRKMLRNSSHIIVPNFFTGNELVELWNVNEANIDIFPLIAFEKISENPTIINNINFPKDFFLHDATFGTETNMDTLLEQFTKYKQNWWKYSLVLHGNAGNHLRSLTENIRALKCEKDIYLTGCLDVYEQEALYNQAKSWIFVGAYNTTKQALSLSTSKNLPMILSDIPAFSLYHHSLKIHPNHLENLHLLLQKMEDENSLELRQNQHIDEDIIFAEYKNILSRNPSL